MSLPELSLSEAREKYNKLKQTDARQASEFALSLAPRFASRQFFYRRLLSADTDLDIRRRAAASALRMAANGVQINSKILEKSANILAEVPDIKNHQPFLDYIGESCDARNKVVALGEIHQAKLERRWDDAYKMLAQYVKDHPQDSRQKLELGLLAYRSGSWGERASAILALGDFPSNDKAIEAFEAVKSFFHACSISPAPPMDTKRLISLQSPTSVFRHALRVCPPAETEGRKGIAMIAPSLAGGGAERIAATICQGLSDKGNPVEVAIYEVGGKSGRDHLFYLPMLGLERGDIQVLDLKKPLREPFSWLPPNLSRKSQAIHDFLAVRRPHTLYLTLDMANLAGGFAGLITGVPNIILHCHNQRPSNVYAAPGMEGWAAAYRVLLEREEIRMVAVSQTVAEDYADWTGVRPSRIKVVRNGLNLNQLMKPDRAFLNAFRSELGIPEISLVVGTAFRFEEVKRPDLWLKMARRVAEVRQDVHFVLFGEGALLEAARLRCRDLGIEERVHFTGHVDDLYCRLPLLDVFVLSSRSEGLQNVLLEAEAAGAIPIAFDVGGCREAMINGTTGLLVREQSDEALARAVLKALDDSEWRCVAKKEGRKLVRSQFSVSRMLTDFNRLLSGGRSCS